MIIESLELKNYRQYQDQKIIFATGKDNRRITVIQGANGTGKTNILNAITWCLYEEERHLGDADRGLPLVNNICLHELDVDRICHVKVELILKKQNNEKMVVRRTASLRKIGENKAERDGHSKLEVFYQTDKDFTLAPDPELTINQCLPRDIQEYFFFHCEKLDDYFKGPLKNLLIKKEVFKISQLELFENVYSHLKNRNDEYSKELKSINPEADHIKHLIDDRQPELEEAEEELERYLREERDAAKLETQIEKDSHDYPSSKEIQDWRKRRDKLEKKRDQLEKDITELSEEYKNFLIKTAPLLMTYEAIIFMKENISIKDAEGLIPPPFRRSFLRELLRRGYCICHTNFSKNNIAKNKVEQLFEECDRVTDISDELSVELKNLETMKNITNSFNKSHVNYARRIKNMQEELEEVNTEEEEISDNIQNVDDEKISDWEKQLSIVKRKKTEATENKTRKKQEIENLKIEVAKLSKDFERELKKIHKHAELKKKLLFCSEAMKTATEIKDEIMDEIRSEIEELTSKQFFEIVWKKENFKSVKINDDYDISVLDQNGVEAIGTLSDGERQVLALSFIAALNIISGFDAPILIDTPLGRISKEPKSNIAEKLPNYLKEKQLTLLVTEEEYTEEVRKIIHKVVGKEYEIIYKETENGNQAEVMEYATKRT
jgi:DNA sulfur modification protein DndD